MYHTEGAGGGHAPDIIWVAGAAAPCPPSSTNPTSPYTINTSAKIPNGDDVPSFQSGEPEDVAFAEAAIRAQTIAAEDFLHDMGAISMLGSDSQGMGRIHEATAGTGN